MEFWVCLMEVYLPLYWETYWYFAMIMRSILRNGDEWGNFCERMRTVSYESMEIKAVLSGL